MPKKNAELGRRGFLKSAAAMVVAPSVVPATALGREGRAAPSERIVMGGMGIGQRGIHDLRQFLRWPDVQFVAVSDPRRDNREGAKAVVDKRYGNKDCAAYIDFREMLARDDIDAVLIATGDRWHAPASVAAMKAGKDVYCEKPGSMSIVESRAVADTARRYGRVFQAGTQRRSMERFAFVAQLARSGKLGKIHTMTAFVYLGLPQHRQLPPQPEPPREILDWNLYLGPAPWRPYNKAYLNWGGHADLSAGGIAGSASHTVDLCQWVNDEGPCPVEYEFPANYNGQRLVTHYANGVKLFLKDARIFPMPFGIRAEGNEGWAQCSDSDEATFEPKSLGGERKRIVDNHLAQCGRPLDHWRDFLDCVKTRRHPICPAEAQQQACNTAHIAAICIRLRRDLTWDPLNERFVGDEEANRMRSIPRRTPWVL